MNRRGFLAGLGALIGGIALEKAVPLGRVWSFPKEIKCLNSGQYISYWFTAIAETLDSQNLRYRIISPLPHPAIIDKTVYSNKIKIVSA